MRKGKWDFDFDFYIKRNEQVAKEKYGEWLDENRRVVGTNIWFDDCWRVHTDQEVTEMDEKIIEILTHKWYTDCLVYNIPVTPSDIKDFVEDLIKTKASKEEYYNGKN